MATTYIEILASQAPFYMGIDALGRTMFSCNYRSESTATNQFEEEIAKIISDASLGTIGTNLFADPSAVLPSGAGPYILLRNTGGFQPDETHDGQKYDRRTIQVVVYGGIYSQARGRANEIYTMLNGKRNITVTT